MRSRFSTAPPSCPHSSPTKPWAPLAAAVSRARATTSQNPSDSAGARFGSSSPGRRGFCRSGNYWCVHSSSVVGSICRELCFVWNFNVHLPLMSQLKLCT